MIAVPGKLAITFRMCKFMPNDRVISEKCVLALRLLFRLIYDADYTEFTHPKSGSSHYHTQHSHIRRISVAQFSRYLFFSCKRLKKYSLAILVHKSVSANLPFPIITDNQLVLHWRSIRFPSNNRYLLPKLTNNYGKFITKCSDTLLLNSSPTDLKE